MSLTVAVILFSMGVIVVSGAVGVVVWMFNLWQKEGLLAEVSFLVFLLPALFATVFFGFRFVALREWRRLRKLRNERQAILRHQDFHEIEGGHLFIKITGEVAKKQWPEIARRLDEWEQEAKETDG